MSNRQQSATRITPCFVRQNSVVFYLVRRVSAHFAVTFKDTHNTKHSITSVHYKYKVTCFLDE